MQFRKTLEGLVERPWAVDDLDAALDALTRPQPHAHALIFVDNAGSDVVLGGFGVVLDLRAPRASSDAVPGGCL